MVLDDRTEADIFGIHGDELEAAVQVFHVRDGRIRSQRGWVVEKVADTTDAEFVEQLLTQIYADHADRIPKEILVPALPEDIEDVTTWLTELRGSKVSLRVAA